MPSSRPPRSELAVAIGARLRALREGRGISLGDLAARARIGKGTLSELETGQRNPTIETLFAITTALGLPFSAALPAVEAQAPAAVAVSGEAIEAVLVDRFIDATATTELYRVTIAAGRSQESAPHAPGVTEHWIVYAGVLELGPIGAPVRLGAGESTTFTGDVPHRYRAHEEADVAAALLVRYPGTGAGGISRRPAATPSRPGAR
jgi:transcriptional regulator with XRE-family HTH domain